MAENADAQPSLPLELLPATIKVMDAIADLPDDIKARILELFRA